jgi:hypothetical protein
MSTGPDQGTEPKFVVTNTLIVRDKTFGRFLSGRAWGHGAA